MSKTLKEIILNSGISPEEFAKALKELFEQASYPYYGLDVNKDADSIWCFEPEPFYDQIRNMQESIEIPACDCGGHKTKTTHSSWCLTEKKK